MSDNYVHVINLVVPATRRGDCSIVHTFASSDMDEIAIQLAAHDPAYFHGETLTVLREQMDDLQGQGDYIDLGDQGRLVYATFDIDNL